MLSFLSKYRDKIRDKKQNRDYHLQNVVTFKQGHIKGCKPLISKQKPLVYSLFSEERVMGIEPTYPAWKAGVLPLNYTRL